MHRSIGGQNNQLSEQKCDVGETLGRGERDQFKVWVVRVKTKSPSSHCQVTVKSLSSQSPIITVIPKQSQKSKSGGSFCFGLPNTLTKLARRGHNALKAATRRVNKKGKKGKKGKKQGRGSEQQDSGSGGDQIKRQRKPIIEGKRARDGEGRRDS